MPETRMSPGSIRRCLVRCAGLVGLFAACGAEDPAEQGEPLWHTEIPGCWGQGIALSPSGRVVFGGFLDDGYGVCLAEIDETDGTIRWQVESEEDAKVQRIAVAPDGGIYVAGDFGFVLRRYEANGDLAWSTADAEFGIGVDVSADGNAVVAGVSDGSAWVGRYSPDGTQIWSQTYDGPVDGPDQATDVAVDDAGAVVAGFQFTGWPETYNVWVTKLDSVGDTIWTATESTPGEGSDKGESVGIDLDGNAYVLAVLDEVGAQVMAVRSFAPDGGQRWAVDREGGDVPGAIDVGPSGQSLAAFQRDDQSILLALDANGTERWASAITSLSQEVRVGDVAIAEDSSPFIVGTFDGSDTTTAWVRRYEPID